MTFENRNSRLPREKKHRLKETGKVVELGCMD